MVYTFLTNGIGYLDLNDKYFMGLHYEKHNLKVITSKRVKKIHDGRNVMTTKRTYEPAYWKITYYKIPVDVLKLAGLKFEQGNRTFKLVKK